MLDLKLWTKLYWENDQNHWSNLANELTVKDPYAFAMELTERIQKINDDYFQECSEGSSGYHPTVETDKKFKNLKKALGEKSKQISIKDWVNELNTVREKAVLFFYYFSQQTRLKEKVQIISMIPNYNQSIIDYFKNEIIKSDKEQDKDKVENDFAKIFNSLNNELQRIAEEGKSKSNQLILHFFNNGRKEEWFKTHLTKIVLFPIFLYFNAHLLEETNEDLTQWSQYLKNNASEKSLIQFNSNLISYLNMFDNEDRFVAFTNLLPIEYGEAFKKLIFSDLNTLEQLEKWYAFVVKDETNPRLFFNKIWLAQEKGVRITTKLIPESMILDFIADKMSVIYSKEEIKNFDFTQSLIVNDNLQEVMNKKISYYYLENKLNKSNSIKTKSMKI